MFGLGWDLGYTWVYKMWVLDLFVHECMKQVSYRIELIFFQLGFVQIHTPCNRKWKETTHNKSDSQIVKIST
jgi:hypothetical protein